MIYKNIKRINVNNRFGYTEYIDYITCNNIYR